MDTTHSESRLNLAVLVEIARTLVRREAVAQAICAHAVAGLGLAGASISLITQSTGGPRLESVAAVGQHSSFIREMSLPLDNLTDASRTALGGEPVFVGNPHGRQEDAGRTDGVGRWRDGFGAHAYAVLALTVLEGTIGVLTLEWPTPYVFADADRKNLQLFADVVALVLRSAPSDAPQAPAAEPADESFDDVEFTAFQAYARGLVVPDSVATSWGRPPLARLWTARSPQHPTNGSAAFAEIMGAPSGGVLMAVGAIAAGEVGRASQVTSAGREVLRAAVMHGGSSGEVLGMLGSSMHSQALGASASGIVATFHSATGALEVATAGSVALAILGREGRFELTLPKSPPIGTARVVPTSQLHLVLPGDRIALLSGHVSTLADPNAASKAERALATLPDSGGVECSRALLALVRGEDLVAAVSVLEVAEGPPERAV